QGNVAGSPKGGAHPRGAGSPIIVRAAAREHEANLMDILLPSVKEQPAAAPWLLHREQIDLPRLICEAAARREDPTVEQVEEELQKRGVDLPRELIAFWIRDCKESRQG